MVFGCFLWVFRPAFQPSRSYFRVVFLRFVDKNILVGLPGRRSNFRAGYRQDSNLESLNIGPLARPKAGQRVGFEAFPIKIRPTSGPEIRCPARKHYCGILGIWRGAARVIARMATLALRVDVVAWTSLFACSMPWLCLVAVKPPGTIIS